MNKRVILIVLIICLFIISGCEQYVKGRKINEFDNNIQLSNEIQQSFTIQNKEQISTENIRRYFDSDSIASLNYNQPVTSFGINGRVTVNDEGYILIILHGKDNEEILVFDSIVVSKNEEVNLNEICEESCILIEEVIPDYLEIKVFNAELFIDDYVFDEEELDDIQELISLKEDLHEIQKNTKIDRMNEIIEEEGANWVAGDNFLLDMSYSERKKYLGLIEDNELDDTNRNVEENNDIIDEGNEGRRERVLPRSLDWRDKNGGDWMTPVKNQENCGSCWVFAATSIIETWYNIQENNPNLDLDLSEQHSVSCAKGGGCGGGLHANVLDLAMKKGITDEECFPYEAKDEPDVFCDDKCEEGLLYTIPDYGIYVSRNPDSDIIKKLIINSPISTSIILFRDFIYYDSGIYEHLEGGIWASHAVASIGWGHDENTRLYWIERNSWGSDWGEEGYFRIYQGETEMHIVNSFIRDTQNFTGWCNDSDGGINVYELGTCNSPMGGQISDECVGDEQNILKDPICGLYHSYKATVHSCQSVYRECYNGCSGGACIPFSCSRNENSEYKYVWYCNEENYDILEDECNGFRCLKKYTQMNPTCYNEEDCNENCDSSKDEVCININEWQNTCGQERNRRYEGRD